MESHPTSDQIARFLGSQTAQENRRFASHLLECDAVPAGWRS